MNQFEVLLKNLKEYLKYATEAYTKGDFNAAMTLFFKSLVAVCDYIILQKTGTVPSSHENRFRTLEIKFPSLYKIIDRDFPYYTESYRIAVDKRLVDLVRQDVENIVKQFKLDEKIK